MNMLFTTPLHCRLEPIVDIVSNKIVGGEVLCKPEGFDAEYYFREISANDSLEILIAQMNYYCAHPISRLLFVNIRAIFLSNDVYFNKIKKVLQGRYLELDNTELMKDKGYWRAEGQNCLARLHRWGMALWLDDANEDSLSFLADLPFHFDGIKIDKFAFWRMVESSKQCDLPNYVEQLSRHTPHIVVEGVETPEQRGLALMSGIQFGQGYLWPAHPQEAFQLRGFKMEHHSQ